MSKRKKKPAPTVMAVPHSAPAESVEGQSNGSVLGHPPVTSGENEASMHSPSSIFLQAGTPESMVHEVEAGVLPDPPALEDNRITPGLPRSPKAASPAVIIREVYP